MATSRRERVAAMLQENPGDTFLRYALALELEKEGDHSGSLERLTDLQREQPPYVPAFFMAAQQLARLGRVEESRGVLRTGIEAARAAGDLHAAGEMGEFLANLGALGE